MKNTRSRSFLALKLIIIITLLPFLKTAVENTVNNLEKFPEPSKKVKYPKSRQEGQQHKSLVVTCLTPLLRKKVSKQTMNRDDLNKQPTI